jgi:hypothetical protein
MTYISPKGTDVDSNRLGRALAEKMNEKLKPVLDELRGRMGEAERELILLRRAVSTLTGGTDAPPRT